MQRHPTIYMSRRFDKAYRKSSIKIQGLVEGTIHDLVNRFRADRTQFKQQYGRHAQLPEILEIDVTGGCRLLAKADNAQILLLELGKHEIVPRYDGNKLKNDHNRVLAAPDTFWPEGPSHGLRFFVREPCLSYSAYGPEQRQEWIYFLSDQQREVVEDIVLKYDQGEEEGYERKPVFVVGGPGTGKTSILLNLLKQFTDWGICTQLACSQQMLDFIDAWAPEIEIRRFRTESRAAAAADVLLIDDPRDESNIYWHLENARRHNKVVILAFDPCQLSTYDSKTHESGISDWYFQDLCEKYHVVQHRIDHCYRQKENVGRAAQKIMNAIAASSPFLAQEKINEFHKNHAALTQLSNTLTFPNPYGYSEVYEDATADDVEKEIRRIAQLPQWSHWPSLLVAFDRDVQFRITNLLNQIDGRVQTKKCSLKDVESVKGQEFQHTFVFIGKKLFHDLEEGFQGSGQQEYASRRLIRIPFSRSKDSIVVFVAS